MNLIPGLSLRVSADEESAGLDDGQLGEFAYDYVELSRHVTDLIGASEDGHSSRGSLKGVPVSQPGKVDQPDKDGSGPEKISSSAE